MDWFTSDLHFGHAKLAKIRGYDSVEAHDNALVEKINAQAQSMSDVIYIVGDFSFHKPERTASILADIVAGKVLIKGNHDHRTRNKMGSLLHPCVMEELWEFHHYLERRFEVFTPVVEAGGDVFGSWAEQEIAMFHFPMMHWRGQDKGAWQLHGHLHGNPSGVPGKALDVGWDKWGKLLSLSEIKTEMDKLPERANHHEPMIDYEKLLKWYIKHVGECEGVNFLSQLDTPWGNTDLLSEAEKTALLEAAK